MPLPGQPDTHPQVLMRRHRIYTDQHGRKWEAQVEKETDDPCTTIFPYGGWSAPLMPPQSYLRIVRDEQGERPAIEIDYGAWVGDLQNAHREWGDALMRAGLAVHKEEFDVNEPSRTVLMLVGPKPHPYEPVIMAKNGDSWVLGLSQDKPAWAKAFFAPKRSDEDEVLARMLAMEDAAPKRKQQRSEVGAA